MARCVLNTGWPGDDPPLKRLFGRKLKTVYLKKQMTTLPVGLPVVGGGDEAMWMDEGTPV